MVTVRVRVVVVGAVVLALAACRGRTVPRPDPGAAGSAGAPPVAAGGMGAEGGAPDTPGGAGGAVQGGAAGRVGAGGSDGGAPPAGSAGSAGRGGSPGSSGSAGSAGSAGSVTLPHQNEEETAILAPLATDDETIDVASGTALIDLMEGIGFARGYTMCRCIRSPDEPPADDALDDCATEESGLYFLRTDDANRCVLEKMGELPELVDYLRCWAKWMRADGIEWTGLCEDPDVEHVGPSSSCERSPEIGSALEVCQHAFYCADGTVASDSRCDGRIGCEDESDELSCFEDRGYDWYWCDGTLIYPTDVCRGACEIQTDPPVCDPERSERYLCNDGGEVDVASVCNRTFECEDGSDERYCFK
jgi:hypothetical protein